MNEQRGLHIEYKPFKDRKIKNGVYVECIAKYCINKANSHGLCWEHYDAEYLREENV